MGTLATTLITLLSAITVAHAQGAPTPDGFTPISDGFNKLIGATGGNFGLETGSFGTFVNSIYKLSIRIAGAVAVAMFVWGGILYMVAPFGVAGEGISEAKARMKNAVLGLLMLLATWIIFNQINPDILNLKISAQPLAPLAAPSQTNTSTGSQENMPSLNTVETRSNDGSTTCTGYDAAGNAQPC